MTKDALNKTIEAANLVLKGSLDTPSLIAGIADYVAALNETLLNLDKMPKSDSSLASDLEQLAELHPKVISIAVALLGETSVEMKGLQSKGKAILAYTDTMPKRVSVRPEKKG